MYGYLNLALAAALAWTAAEAEPIQATLLETDPAVVRWDADALVWRTHRFDRETLSAFRRDFFHGFGSCSFREPLDELATLATSQ